MQAVEITRRAGALKILLINETAAYPNHNRRGYSLVPPMPRDVVTAILV
jgi:hypothetical protein